MKTLLIIPILFAFSASELPLINNETSLFIIGRSRDADVIHYDVNIDKNGELHQQFPINIYWVRHTNKGEKDELSWIQNKYAYGLHYTYIGKTRAVFHFVSYPERMFTLEKNYKGRYKVFTSSKNKKIEVQNIFIQITGGTFLLPVISAVELHGIETYNNLASLEIIKP